MMRLGMFSCLILFAPWPAASIVQTDSLTQTKAAYTALKSYSDAGVVTTEYGPPGSLLTEKHTFRTFFRAPRSFFFEFLKNPSTSTERVVVWGDAAAFHSWWSATGVHQTFPPGTGATAFVTTAYPTRNSVLQIASLVFPQAGLAGTPAEMVEARDAGFDTLAGHRCRKLVGKGQSTYAASGRTTNARQVTLWIDADTSLIRQIVEDSSAANLVNRVTTTFDARVNPALDDGAFRFTPPK